VWVFFCLSVNRALFCNIVVIRLFRSHWSQPSPCGLGAPDRPRKGYRANWGACLSGRRSFQFRPSTTSDSFMSMVHGRVAHWHQGSQQINKNLPCSILTRDFSVQLARIVINNLEKGHKFLTGIKAVWTVIVIPCREWFQHRLLTLISREIMGGAWSCRNLHCFGYGKGPGAPSWRSVRRTSRFDGYVWALDRFHCGPWMPRRCLVLNVRMFEYMYQVLNII